MLDPPAMKRVPLRQRQRQPPHQNPNVTHLGARFPLTNEVWERYRANISPQVRLYILERDSKK